MHKFILKIAVLSLAVSAAPAFAATSGTSGASGSSGLGVDYGALVAAGASGNPGVALPGSSATGTLGGPLAGLMDHFTRH